MSTLKRTARKQSKSLIHQIIVLVGIPPLLLGPCWFVGVTRRPLRRPLLANVSGSAHYPSKVDKFPCTLCGADCTPKNKANLKEHIRRRHQREWLRPTPPASEQALEELVEWMRQQHLRRDRRPPSLV